MGMTWAEAKACGLEHLWPNSEDRRRVVSIVSPPEKSAFEGDGMNKLERAFWERLGAAQKANHFETIWREPITLRLAGRTTYKPDFMTLSIFNNQLAFWETKGFMRDDAAVKLKVAAAQFPCFRWVLVQRDRRKWRCIEVTAKGFSRDEWCPDWLA